MLLPGLVLAQVLEHTSSRETGSKKEREWDENIISMRATLYADDWMREEHFRLRSEAYGLVHDGMWSKMPVVGSSAVKPVAHMSICDRTAAVMDAILSRISATNDCSEVTSTQLASITDTLDLSSQNIASLKVGDFDGLISLNALNLGQNALSTLPDGIFDELTSLTELVLQSNHLRSLPHGIFDEMSLLNRLELSNNALSTLPDGVFDELASLPLLLLVYIDLYTLPVGIFDELSSLTWLSLGAIDLSALPDGIFDGLTSLTRLQLHDNDLSILPDGIFDKLTSLTMLDLGGNDLSTLSDGIFDELTSLTLLDLGYNRLSTLPDGIFDKLTSLTGLDLGGNDLSTLQDGIFDGLAKLSLKDSVLSFPAGLSLEANPGAPFSPVANAGADLTVQPGAAVSISGRVTGPWGDFVRWDWIQVDGPDSDVPISGALPLMGGETAMPSFMAPTAEGDLYFKLVVAPGHKGMPTESYGHAYSAPDWVTVTVSNTPTNTSETSSVVDFNLLGNYPNPFNPSTTILLDVPQVASVTVDVFNVLGQRVHREELPAVAAGASKPLLLDVSHLSSGTYIYQVTARMGKEVHRSGGRMTLIK
ncbi:MAG: leucine-rich repeat protein [Rhodothermaceae bacterium]|nr:leucine-rich repeat protein [Rhodothermaceae bacterium]